jgi:signal transduction histidine kinase
MSSEPANSLAMSLRARVAAWIAGAVLLCSSLLLGLVREGVRQALIHEFDESLLADADEILLERAQHSDDPGRSQETMRNQARSHRDNPWFAQLLSPGGEEVFSTLTTPRDRPQATHFATGKAETVDGYRVLEKPSADGAVVVRVGASLDAIHNDMARIDRLVGTVALIMFLGAPLTGFVLATVILHPITTMSEHTAKLRPQRLDERLPLRGVGDELDQLASVINGLLGRISQYVGEHRGLMADAAHQLRTPLAAIRSSVEVILASDENSEENRDTLLKVIEQIESLQTLVNQLLLLAETEVENLRQPTEGVRLDEIVRRSLEMFDAVAESLGVTLEIGNISPCWVQGNRHYLRQVVNNLIDNALKFTAVKQHAPKTVSVHLTRQEQRSTVRLRITDTGIGISQEHLPHIFGRFYRADTSRRSDGGTAGNGLGLSIVKSVVESHGGHVTVESTPGIGTTFTIELPLSSMPAAAVTA